MQFEFTKLDSGAHSFAIGRNGDVIISFDGITEKRTSELNYVSLNYKGVSICDLWDGVADAARRYWEKQNENN